MSDALPLPARPNLDHYRKRAKDLVKTCQSSDAAALEQFSARWKRVKQTDRTPACTLTNAQFVIAREHGFESWPKFAKHLDGLARARSPVSRFEKAVDAIVGGDAATLGRLVREVPALARARSTREHRSTLLHYVSANGVEDFRQKTPKNIVAIARLLLDAGADVDAESMAYGGRSTALNLTATSIHPAIAGVQNELMQLLLDRGATIDTRDVVSCLRNGRGPAAEYLAERGASLDLEGAAGVGRLDVVQSFFTSDGSLKPTATPEQMADGFAWACGYGKTHVVDFLLRRGMSVAAKLKHHGQTGLHGAAAGGHVDTVRLLLQRRAPLDTRDDSFGGTPIGWALYGWSMNDTPDPRADYYEVVRLLVAAGVPVNPAWRSGSDEFALKVRADARMHAALGGDKMNHGA
jgi:ankyrin repeat protein